MNEKLAELLRKLYGLANYDNLRTAGEVASMTPTPLGDVASGMLAVDDLRKGDYLGAAGNAVGLLPFVPAIGGSIKAYRGIEGSYNPNFKQPVEWFSEGKELAKGYGRNVMQKEIDPKSPIDIGFRDYRTEVKKDDVLDRMHKAILDRFHQKEITKEQAIALNNKIRKMRGGDEFKPAYQWINTQEVVDVLKGLGYDSLEHIENGIKTYGVFK